MWAPPMNARPSEIQIVDAHESLDIRVGIGFAVRWYQEVGHYSCGRMV
jgi:hypothetical protein